MRRPGEALQPHRAHAPARSRGCPARADRVDMPACHSATTMTGAHMDGAPPTVEDAQTPVMNLSEELTAQLGGPSGTAVAAPAAALTISPPSPRPTTRTPRPSSARAGTMNSVGIGAPGSSVRSGPSCARATSPSPLSPTRWGSGPRSSSAAPGSSPASTRSRTRSASPALPGRPRHEPGRPRVVRLRRSEKGQARHGHALHDKGLAAEFQAIIDQSAASWWAPDPLWAKAKQSTAGVFGYFGVGVTSALLGQTAYVPSSTASSARNRLHKFLYLKYRLRPDPPWYDRAPILCGAGASGMGPFSVPRGPVNSLWLDAPAGRPDTTVMPPIVLRPRQVGLLCLLVTAVGWC